MATATVVRDHRNPETWSLAAGIIAAAISGGTRQRAKYRKDDTIPEDELR